MRSLTGGLLLTALAIGGSACGSTADTVDSVVVPSTTPSEIGDDATSSAPATQPVADVPSSASAPITADPPGETTSDSTAITKLSPQAVPSLVTTSTLSTAVGGDEFPLDPSSSLVQGAMTDLAARLDVPRDEVTIVDARAVSWGDSSLGCPQPGMKYLQSVTDGSLVILNVDGVEYRYTGGSPLQLCA